jgi:hypothetical protein
MLSVILPSVIMLRRIMLINFITLNVIEIIVTSHCADCHLISVIMPNVVKTRVIMPNVVGTGKMNLLLRSIDLSHNGHNFFDN